MEKSTGEDIIKAVKDLADQTVPNVRYIAKYGGEVFTAEPEGDKQFVGGVFSYKDHVSVEFSNGATFADPDGHLEGSGKMRRHLKLYTVADVTAKPVGFFLRQAFAV